MKKITLGMLGILIVLMLLPALMVRATGEPSENVSPQTPRPEVDAPCDKLLVEDVYPWDGASGTGTFDPDYQASIDLGYTTKVVNSTTFANPGFVLLDAHGSPMWTVIIFASVQPLSYYNNLISASAKIDGYVSAGGVIVGHVCDYSSLCWDGNSFLPGGVTHVHVDLQNLHIVNPLNIFTGMTDAQISGWGWSTHGYFNSYPAGATILVTVAGEPTQPVYIEYPWGKGLVKATMMTLEWSALGHSWTEPGVTGIGYTIIKNELKEAQVWLPEFGLPTVVVTSVLFAAIAIFLRRKRRLLIKP